MMRRIIVHHRYRVKHIDLCDRRCREAIVTRVEFQERASTLEPWRTTHTMEDMNLPASMLKASMHYWRVRAQRERRGAA